MLPSPKFHPQPVIVPPLPVLKSVKVTGNSTQPVTGAPLKSAVGIGSMVIVCVVVSAQPLLDCTISSTV
ncbi:MAG: hypothetical protein M0D57_13135 [Sphingobacteriales bacterium JAD_PAG50586_3]|nr:MAG: hypothetical protein M0D57_13135 [Sphingobacteriales bacterium JAD_PAG50586_3]